ncbi:MAG TPA: histidine kinase dimerization/phospho-acceptor domain-containing protein [Anaeromyxobacteraceae bacterium]|nr:histidine kinase dimerization/phospho-acceptor domain-containing protein [Anaeromyxobacteraceae bacterium]
MSTTPIPPDRSAPETEERAEETNQRASHLAFVAHEIRNPLATALWSAELLGRLAAEERGGARGEKLTRMCLRAIMRVRRLIEDHLLAERLDAAGIPVVLDAVAVSDLMPDAATLGPIALSVDLEPGALVATDAQLARRAMEAAILVAAREDGPVRVIGSREGSAVRIRIEGAPVEPGELADRRRGDAGDSQGTSLGVGAARRVAAALGGSLSVEERALVLELPALDRAKGDG